MSSLVELLIKYQSHYHSILPAALQHGSAIVLDLSGNDQRWLKVNSQSSFALAELTTELMAEKHAMLAIGRYAEDRAFLYQRSELFQQGNNIRSVHLGIDLTVVTNTPVFCPYMGYVTSIKNNSGFGNYGPTIILQHQLEHKIFYTLYGHLSASSLTQVAVGQHVNAGEQIGAIGDSEINGGWPPHLHFQIIEDLWGNKDDFPGVIDLANKDKYLRNCPDPNLILQINVLN